MAIQISRPSNLNLALLLPVLSTLGACASTQLGSNLGTRITAQENRISLEWQETHPYDSSLLSRPLSLHAEYINAADEQPVHQVLGKGVPRETRERLFELPRSLAAVPTSDVCLYFRYGADVLPIRAADGLNDTSRFGFEAWSELVRRNTSRAATKSAMTEILGNLDQIDPRIEDIREDFSRRYPDIHNTQQCQDFARARAAGKFSTAKPSDVIADSDINDEAQKVCVYRVEVAPVLYSSNPKRSHGKVLLLPLLVTNEALANAVIPRLPTKSKRIVPLIEQSLRRHIGALKSGYKPVLGARADQTIKLPGAAGSISAALQREYMNSGTISDPGSNNVLALFSAEIEAFRGCVVESTNQLKRRAQAWEQAKQDLPERRAAFIEHERGFCTRAYAAKERGLTELEEQRAYLESELARIEGLSNADNATQALPGKPQRLNASMCSLNL